MLEHTTKKSEPSSEKSLILLIHLCNLFQFIVKLFVLGVCGCSYHKSYGLILRRVFRGKFEKFNGKYCFALWKIKIKTLLKQQQIWRSLIPRSAASTSGSGEGLTDGQLALMEEKAHSTILLSLDDHISTEVANQKMVVKLWL